MKNIPNKLTGDLYTAEELNKASAEELKNVVTLSQQTFDESNQNQINTAIARFAGGQVNTCFYHNAGGFPDYTVAYVGSLSGFQPFDSYEDGMIVKFLWLEDTDGVTPLTINVNGLGPKKIAGSDEGLIIKENSLVSFIYLNGQFRLEYYDQSFNLNITISAVLRNQIGEKVIEDTATNQDAPMFARGNFIYLLLNGQTFNTGLYPELALIYPSGVLPDYGSRVLRHLEQGSSRVLGDFEEDGFEAHYHHAYTSLDIAPDGNHFHQTVLSATALADVGNISAGEPIARTWNGENDNDYTLQSIAGTANVGKSSTAGSHDHGGSTASTTIDDTGGAETRMKNIAVQYYVKAKVI